MIRKRPISQRGMRRLRWARPITVLEAVSNSASDPQSWATAACVGGSHIANALHACARMQCKRQRAHRRPPPTWPRLPCLRWLYCTNAHPPLLSDTPAATTPDHTPHSTPLFTPPHSPLPQPLLTPTSSSPSLGPPHPRCARKTPSRRGSVPPNQHLHPTPHYFLGSVFAVSEVSTASGFFLSTTTPSR